MKKCQVTEEGANVLAIPLGTIINAKGNPNSFFWKELSDYLQDERYVTQEQANEMFNIIRETVSVYDAVTELQKKILVRMFRILKEVNEQQPVPLP